MIYYLDRRQFLRGLGGFSLALPFLPSLFPSKALAAGPVPKRFVAILQGHCYFGREFWPTAPTDVLANPLMTIRSRDLTQITGSLSPILSDPKILSMRSKVTLLRGIQNYSACGENNHPSDRMLRGSAIDPGNESMDVVLSNWSQFYQQPPKQRILSFASHNIDSPQMSNKKTPGGTIGLSMDIDPIVLFNRVFTNSGAAPGISENNKKQFIVDRVLVSFNQVRNSARISKAEKIILENHIESIYEIQKSLGSVSSPTCQEPATPSTTYNVKTRQNLAMKIITSALVCDRSRIATIYFKSGDSGDGADGIYDGSWHENGHPDNNEIGMNAPNSVRRTNQTNFGKYVASMIGEMMEQFNAAVEDTSTGATALDNSIIYWSNGMGDVDDYGGSLSTHGDECLKTFLAGGGNLGIKTGQFLHYVKRFTGVGYPYDGTFGYKAQAGPSQNQLLVSLLRAFGMSPEEFETTGKKGFGSYGKYFGDSVGEELYNDKGYMALIAPLVADRRAPLPGLMKT
ncbi:MAG: DUF1552 domain-containing protein [Bdellovibrionales bacterium]|nr:DUF1552 domain-containing protein [Bdellovibrionales bacterium]